MRGLTPEANPAEKCDIIAAMISQVRIQNLGKLADATVRIGGLTVLAGVNNTGKTFFSKSLHSIIGALNTDHLLVEFSDKAEPLRENLRHLTGGMFASTSPPSVAQLIEAVDRMELAAKECSAQAGDSIVAPDKEYPALKESAEKMHDVHEQLDSALRAWVVQGGDPSEPTNAKFRAEAGELYSLIEQNVHLLHKLGSATMGKITSYGFGAQILRNFPSNFQVQSFNDLKSERGVTDIHINGAPILCFDEVGGVQQNLTASTPVLLQMRRRSNSFFLDSPALWRMKEILHGVLLESRNGRARADVPDYFRALFVALLKKYSGDIPFPEVFRRLTEDVIRGKIVQDDLGRLFYAETGKGVYPLWQVATGVVNIGILALLIERKLLDPGAFLFIDEPESNLHPEWQVEMTEALWALARGGVNVVIATHSADILKRLDVYAEEERETAESMLAVNHFRRDGAVQSGGAELIMDVQEDLSTPFFELYKRAM